MCVRAWVCVCAIRARGAPTDAAAQVFVRRWPVAEIPPQYFKSMIPEVAIAMCKSCNQFYHQEDLEFAVLEKEQCPFCRCKPAAVGLP